nr:STARP-like antigen [Hymenolepis microstoma]
MERKRIKKQNTERRRRTRISDQITQLHDLALSVVGKAELKRVSLRLEKVEMLSFCQDVLKLIVYLMDEIPEVKRKFVYFLKGFTINANGQLVFSGPCGSGSNTGTQDSSSNSSCLVKRNRSHNDSMLPLKKRQHFW